MEQLNVSQLLKSSIGSTREYELNGVVDINDCDHTLLGRVKLMRTNRGILATASLNTESELTCSRCLSPFDYPLTLNIEEEYFPTADVVSGASLALPDEPGCFTIDENSIIDLTEAIRQYGLLAFPMKPLCRQDCAGLCPTCGVNLNHAQCDCPPVAKDHRWAELSKLVLTDTDASPMKQGGTD
ncbi:MAG: DUF177 domain-containing protein [Dehalococcoidales bacterium]|jgi:uncharacterized protein|nr:DUF177 domain-containing protein [Dehalococcoidales bacterium]